jgi:dTDP-4-amino-4,6-dideoxygalactose transaminase
MDDIRASLACVQTKKLGEDLVRRAKVRKWYEERLHSCDRIAVPYLNNPYFVSNYIFPVVLQSGTKETREQVREYLQTRGIQTSVHYPAAHRFRLYRDCKAYLPKTEYITDHEITLPMYGSLEEEQVEYICRTLAEAVKL